MDVNQELAKELLELLKTIGSSVATAGFDIAIRHVIIQAWTSIIYTAMLTGIYGFVVWKAYPIISHKVADKHDIESALWFVIVISGVLIVVLNTIMIFEAIPSLLLPEWYAIRQIVNLVK